MNILAKVYAVYPEEWDSADRTEEHEFLHGIGDWVSRCFRLEAKWGAVPGLQPVRNIRTEQVGLWIPFHDGIYRDAGLLIYAERFQEDMYVMRHCMDCNTELYVTAERAAFFEEVDEDDWFDGYLCSDCFPKPRPEIAENFSIIHCIQCKKEMHIETKSKPYSKNDDCHYICQECATTVNDQEIITIYRGVRDWKAHLKGKPEVWGSSVTEDEAIKKLQHTLTIMRNKNATDD